MYIYNDFAGYGMTKVLENLADFHKIIFKKDVSLLKKWSYVEGLVTWLYAGDLMTLMTNASEKFSYSSSPSWSRSSKSFPNTPHRPHLRRSKRSHSRPHNDQVPPEDAADHRIDDIEKIVQAADKAGVQWNFRKVGVSEEDAKELRECIEPRAKKPDWKKEWPSFKRNHPGGKKYDITKMSKAEKKQYEFGGGEMKVL